MSNTWRKVLSWQQRHDIDSINDRESFKKVFVDVIRSHGITDTPNKTVEALVETYVDNWIEGEDTAPDLDMYIIIAKQGLAGFFNSELSNFLALYDEGMFND